MEIVAGLFIENIDFRKDDPGGPTKIDITGAYFSVRVGEFPHTVTPHLVVLLRAEDDEGRNGTMTVQFAGPDGSDIAQHRAPVFIQPPGNFFYQLVRPELRFDGPGTIEARCEIVETGSKVVVPLTAL
jgi:hypothetical protein